MISDEEVGKARNLNGLVREFCTYYTFWGASSDEKIQHNRRRGLVFSWADMNQKAPILKQLRNMRQGSIPKRRQIQLGNTYNITYS